MKLTNKIKPLHVPWTHVSKEAERREMEECAEFFLVKEETSIPNLIPYITYLHMTHYGNT